MPNCLHAVTFMSEESVVKQWKGIISTCFTQAESTSSKQCITMLVAGVWEVECAEGYSKQASLLARQHHFHHSSRKQLCSPQALFCSNNWGLFVIMKVVKCDSCSGQAPKASCIKAHVLQVHSELTQAMGMQLQDKSKSYTKDTFNSAPVKPWVRETFLLYNSKLWLPNHLQVWLKIAFQQPAYGKLNKRLPLYPVSNAFHVSCGPAISGEGERHFLKNKNKARIYL